MTLSEVSIRRPVMAWMLMGFLIIFGGISFMRMGISQLPDVDFPVVSVSLSMEGAAPEVMESDIVDMVEDSVMSIEGVRTVTSTSLNGSANVVIEFELNRNIDLAMQDVQAKIAQVQRKLPKEMDPPVVSKTNPDDQPIIWLALTSDTLPLRDLMIYTRDHLKDQFSTVSGVGDLFLGGYLEPNMRIWVDDKALQRYQLSINDVINTVQKEHSEPPAGFLDRGSKEYNVRVLGEATSGKQFDNLIINFRGGQPNYRAVRLGQVARTEEGLEDVRKISRAMGRPAVGIGIQKQRGSNAVEVARGVHKKMAEIQKMLPKGMSLVSVFDSTKFIEQSVGELNFTLLLSAIFTALVCWIFLGSWSSTLNVLLAIPTSIVGTFIVLYFAGFTLNTFTLLGLSLAIGIVVDDAIMVLENIIRHREKGMSRRDAALVGSREITFAALAASLAIIAIFLPVAFMKGIIGKFFYQFGVTITVAVALSLLEALTLTPMRCAAFVDVPERTTKFGRFVERSFDWLTEQYRHTLGIVLRHRWITLGLSLLFFALSFYSVKWLNKEFLPAEDQSRFVVRVETPVGSSLAFTDSKMRQIEAILGKRPEVLTYYVSIGGYGGGQVNSAFAFVTMKDPGHRGVDPKLGREMTQQDLMAYCRKHFNAIPGVKAMMLDLSNRGFSTGRGYPVEFTIQGPDWNTLATYGNKMMKELERTGMVTDVDTDYQVGMPELQVLPDRAKAAARGVSIVDIGQVVNAAIGGYLVGQYPQGGHRYDIRIKLPDNNREDEVERVRNLWVRNNRGELVRLGDVVNTQIKPTLQIINRRARERAFSVYANIAKGKSQQTVLDEVQRIGARILPSGYHIVLSGSSQTFQESFQSLIIALLLGLVVAYMVLASQFNSFLDPFTVLTALPFSFSGAFLGLLLTHQSINLYSLIGLILLMGIVKKNSILLVDFTNQVRDAGEHSVREALLRACPIRLRPILMTSLATIAGAIPPALSIGPGAESRIPMAVAVIGGVLVSTVLTLYVVPCVYSIFTRTERKAVPIAEEAAGVMVTDFNPVPT